MPISYCQYSNNLNILLHQAKDRACSRVWGGMWTEVGKHGANISEEQGKLGGSSSEEQDQQLGGEGL